MTFQNGYGLVFVGFACMYAASVWLLIVYLLWPVTVFYSGIAIASMFAVAMLYSFAAGVATIQKRTNQ